MRRAFQYSADALLRTSRTHATRNAFYVQRRRLHEPTGLPYDTSEGLGRFMSPQTLEVVSMEYQKGLLQRLDAEVEQDGDLKNKSIFEQVQHYADKRNGIIAFNYASQALNNSFFLDMLKPPTPHPAKAGGKQTFGHQADLNRWQYQKFLSQIDSDFGSLAGLKSAFSAAAMGMFSSGWVWLIHDSKGRLAVTTTYGPGTVLVRSRIHKGPREWVLHAPNAFTKNKLRPKFSFSPSSKSSPSSETLQSSSPAEPLSNPSAGLGTYSPVTRSPTPKPPLPRSFMRSVSSTNISQSPSPAYSAITATLHDFESSVGRSSDTSSSSPKEPEGPYVGGRISPLFTCSIHEHCWLRDHGIWGKEEYLKSFWEVLDWAKVGDMWNEAEQPRSKYFSRSS